LASLLIEKRFEPNALRLKFNRRTCLDFNNTECKLQRPPVADFPNYSSQVTHLADLMHLDVKTGEHTFGGQRFDAEMQLMHMHLDDPRVGYIAIPVQAQAGGYNDQFQAVLDEFQNVYNIHKAECAAQQLRRRGTARWSPRNDSADASSSTLLDDPNLQHHRQLLTLFDPYTDFLKNIYFYRYDGSSPDPPCFPVTWFVMTTPVVIDLNQLRQMKQLLFTHVNSNCLPTSVHNAEQSVARPVQPMGTWRETGKPREVMLCQEGDISPDLVDGTP
jgi:carbonic anhydrase